MLRNYEKDQANCSRRKSSGIRSFLSSPCRLITSLSSYVHFNSTGIPSRGNYFPRCGKSIRIRKRIGIWGFRLSRSRKPSRERGFLASLFRSIFSSGNRKSNAYSLNFFYFSFYSAIKNSNVSLSFHPRRFLVQRFTVVPFPREERNVKRTVRCTVRRKKKK